MNQDRNYTGLHIIFKKLWLWCCLRRSAKLETQCNPDQSLINAISVFWICKNIGYINISHSPIHLCLTSSSGQHECLYKLLWQSSNQFIHSFQGVDIFQCWKDQQTNTSILNASLLAWLKCFRTPGLDIKQQKYTSDGGVDTSQHSH